MSTVTKAQTQENNQMRPFKPFVPMTTKVLGDKLGALLKSGVLVLNVKEELKSAQ